MSSDHCIRRACVSAQNWCFRHYGSIIPFLKLPAPAQAAILEDDSFMFAAMGPFFLHETLNLAESQRMELNIEQLTKLHFWYGRIPINELEPLTRPHIHDWNMPEEYARYDKYPLNYDRPVFLSIRESARNQALLDGYHRMYCFYVRYRRDEVPALARTKCKIPSALSAAING